MAKAKKMQPQEIPTTKTAEESSMAFHNIMKASVANNPKPKAKKEEKKNKTWN